MKLIEWRTEQGKTRQWVASELETIVPTVFRWELDAAHPDKRVPGFSYMRQIYVLTKGAVEPNDFYDLPPLGHQLQLPMVTYDPPLLVREAA